MLSVARLIMKPKGRNVPPPRSIADLLTTHPGLYILQYFHDDFCPGATNGTGEHCCCSPDVRLVRWDTKEIIASIETGSGAVRWN